ncbi:MAG: hypothetical protein EZS28_003323 [Streblomastix strix]|uniref:C2 domain-containing protein n=1 Tax=Streblomastix strix TaxID=222440 RepID=A0A5J4X1F4_9EUKA|nr:MAG: hypothetical protein EZS28_003323 [Streblomastix strix]
MAQRQMKQLPKREEAEKPKLQIATQIDKTTSPSPGRISQQNLPVYNVTSPTRGPNQQGYQNQPDVRIISPSKGKTPSTTQLELLTSPTAQKLHNYQNERNKNLPQEHPYPKGIVRISEIGVRGFPELDGNNRIYPYIDLRTPTDGQKTSVSKSTVNYDYQNEILELIFDPRKAKGKPDLTLQVFNYDKQGVKYLLGTADVDVTPSFNKLFQAEKKIFPIRRSSQEADQQQYIGKVVFKIIYFEDNNLIKKIEDEESRRIQLEEQRRSKGSLAKLEQKGPTNKAEKSTGFVEFSRISVQNLPKKDVIGKADPFVLFRLGKEEKRTSVAKNALSYIYENEQYQLLYDPVQMKGKKEVDIEVWDFDSIGHNDLIGTASVIVLPSMNKPVQVELFLQSLKNKQDQTPTQFDLASQQNNQKLGKVKFQMIFINEMEVIDYRDIDFTEDAQQSPKARQLKQSRSQDLLPKQPEYLKGVLKFSSIQVKNLPPMISGGKQNPFALFLLGYQQQLTSVGRNTLDYIYRDETYDLIYDPVQLKGKKEVDVEVWSKDSAENSVMIGSASVDILPFLNKQTTVELFLQPHKIKKEQVQQQFNFTSQQTDSQLGKIIFKMLYLQGEEWIKKYKEEQIIRRKEYEERKNKDTEDFRRQEEEKKRKIEEEKRRNEEQEELRRNEEEKRRNEELRRLEEEKRRKVLEEDKKRNEEEKKRKEELNKRNEEEKKRIEEELRRKAIEGKKRQALEEEQRRQALEEELKRKSLEEEQSRNREFSPTKPRKGFVEFSHIQVRDLRQIQKKDKSRPFVIFKLGDEEKETSIAQYTQNYDYQKEEHNFLYDPVQMNGKKEADIEVWDYDKENGNVFIGTASVEILPSLGKLTSIKLFLQTRKTKQEQTQQQFNLTSSHTDAGLGRVNFKMIYVNEEEIQKERSIDLAKINTGVEYQPKLSDRETVSKWKSAIKTQIALARSPQYVKGIIKISNVAVHNLQKIGITGKLYPYVLLRLGYQQKLTTIAKNTSNYYYENEQFDFVYDPAQMKGKKEIEVEVWDYDSIAGNHFIGYVSLNILPSFKKIIDTEVFLQQKKKTYESQTIDPNQPLKDQKIGSVSLSMIYIPGEEAIKEIDEDRIRRRREEEEELKRKTEQDQIRKREFSPTKLNRDEERRRIEEEEEARRRKEKEELRRQEEARRRTEEVTYKKREYVGQQFESQQFENQQFENLQTARGIVRISKIQVKDIAPMDIGGKADPYVVFSLGPFKKETSIARNTLSYDYKDEQLDVVYEQTQMNGKQDLEVEVWDYDAISGNDFVGTASVNILPSLNQQIQVELYLQPKEKKLSQQKTYSPSNVNFKLGKISFWMIYIPEQEQIQKSRETQIKPRSFDIQPQQQKAVADNRNVEQVKERSFESNPQQTKGYLKISNVKLRNLTQLDINGKSDPYIIFSLGNLEKKTTIAKNVFDYDYNGEEFDMEYDPGQVKGPTQVQVEVFDHDTIGSDDYIGYTRVDILPALSRKKEYCLFLQPKQEITQQKTSGGVRNLDNKLGKVIFQMEYIPGQEQAKGKQQKGAEEIYYDKQQEEVRRLAEEKRKRGEANSKYVKGYIEFSHIGVYDLPKMDLIGKSDPYVLFQIGFDQQQTSIAKNTLSYEYKNEVYVMEYDPAKLKGQREVDIEVWDYDSIGGNDFIGTVSVDVLPYLNKQGIVELYLQPKREDGNQTTILSLNQNQKLGSIAFWMLYTPGKKI